MPTSLLTYYDPSKSLTPQQYQSHAYNIKSSSMVVNQCIRG
uniref:Uncharacterized protein n=1 Tax=Arundo donax TaxID=35708 RepID=A0A0A9A704_ARUDO